MALLKAMPQSSVKESLDKVTKAFLRVQVIGSPVVIPTVLGNDPKDRVGADTSVKELKQSVHPSFSSANHHIPESFLQTKTILDEFRCFSCSIYKEWFLYIMI